MNFLARASLRQMLTVPYVALVVLAAALIGVLSYDAGTDAVDNLSDQLLTETVNRIVQAVDKHVSGSEAVLETAFPADVPAPASIKDDLTALRTRFWMATTIHRDPNNYAYYGDVRGHFIGLWRHSEEEAELRLRVSGAGPRTIYRFSHLMGDLKNPLPEERIFDPRERPWYKAAKSATTQTWTSIYIDFKTLQLVGTRAKRVNDASGGFAGVVATDLSLQHLNDFLRTLKLSANGYAFIVEPDGKLLAASRGPHLRSGKDGNERLNAADSNDPWMVVTYNTVKTLISRSDAPAGTRTTAFTGPDGAIIQAGYARLRDKAGLDWIVAVAVPRSDFLHKVTENVRRTALLALLVCVLIALTGFAVLSVIAGQLRQLAAAARDMGEGQATQIPVDRSDEIGDLAKSFAHMQERLLSDQLTGIANREAITRRIENRILRRRRQGDSHPFAVLYLDMNEFSLINEQFGHDTGDKVLVEIAQRLKANLRDTDIAARYGGDEFVALLDNVSHPEQARAARDKLEQALAMPLKTLMDIGADAEYGAGAAIGMALCPEHGQDLESLLKYAGDDMRARKSRDEPWQ